MIFRLLIMFNVACVITRVINRSLLLMLVIGIAFCGIVQHHEHILRVENYPKQKFHTECKSFVKAIYLYEMRLIN